MDVRAIYDGSDGEATRALYAQLSTFGAIGEVGINLFRASKCSARAKVYRGRTYRESAYGRKNWSMDNLCRVLRAEAGALAIVWGWKEDPAAEFHRWVLYVEIPTGQVSFHAASKGEGPAYEAEWDGKRGESADRIVRWCQSIIHGCEPGAPTPSEPAPRWLWCKHCQVFWANRRTCPVNRQHSIENRGPCREVLPVIRSGLRAQWDEQQPAESRTT